MLSFFRINDPYRLIPVFIILLILRIPFMIDLTEVTFYEIKWMALGSKMAEGASMYVDIWDNTAPLSAGIFWLLDIPFGRSHFVYYLFGLLLVFYQCALFNAHIIRNNAMQENTYLPAFIYGILMSITEEFMILSPLLIGLTFFMMSLNNVFGQIQIRAKRDEKIMMIGIYMGIATMCHYVFAIVFLAIILILMIFSGTVLRRYLLMITGFLIPVFIIGLYYLMIDGLRGMLYFGTAFGWRLGIYKHLNSQALLILTGFPLLLLLLSLFRYAGRSRLSNFQSRLLQSMILILIVGLASFWSFSDRSLMPFIIIVPSLAYLISQYFLLLRKGLMTELWFFISILILSATSFTFHFGWFGMTKYLDNKELLVTEIKPEFDQQRVLILGTDWPALRKADHVTPFFNWSISSEIFNDLDYYDNQTIILEKLEEGAPEYIIDNAGLFQSLNDRFPYIRNNYRKGPQTQVYQKMD